MDNLLKRVMRTHSSENELRRMCKEITPILGDQPIIVELGSYMGESTLIFSEEFPSAKIYSVDIWEGGFDDNDSASKADYNEVERQFDLRLPLMNNVTKIKGKSTEFDVECDMVYIDACHKYECVKNDILYWKNRTKKIISGHDYNTDEFIKIHPHIAGVKVAVNEILGDPDLLFSDGSWVKFVK